MIKELQEKIKNKKFNDCINQCDALIQESSTERFEHYLFKAYAYRELNEYDKSKKTYMEGLKLFPGNIDLLNDFSRLLVLNKEYDTAKDILKNILKKSPQSKTAAKNLDALECLIKKQDEGSDLNRIKHEASRSMDPLLSAFNPSEIEACYSNLKKVKKLRLERKLNQLPDFPSIEEDILSEEWLIAAKDSLRAKHPNLALKFCEYSAATNGNLAQIYGVAGDAYMELKQFTNAHLCYSIALENGELESSQQLNLLSLTAMTGDKQLLEKRNSHFNEKLQGQPKLYQGVQKLLSNIGNVTTIRFDPKYGPINEKNLNEYIKKD